MNDLLLPQWYGFAAFGFASLGGIEKGEDLQCLIIGHRGLARLEELDDLYQEGPVTGMGFRLGLYCVLRAEDHCAKIAVWPQRPDRAHPAIAPASHNDIGALTGNAAHLA